MENNIKDSVENGWGDDVKFNVWKYWGMVALLLFAAERGCNSVAHIQAAPVRAAVAQCLKKCNEGDPACAFVDSQFDDVDAVTRRRLEVVECANNTPGLSVWEQADIGLVADVEKRGVLGR